MTKVCIFGAGSIGGYIAACLKKTDVDVTILNFDEPYFCKKCNQITIIKKLKHHK